MRGNFLCTGFLTRQDATIEAEYAGIVGKSFDILTARHYLEQLVHPSFDDLNRQPTSSRAAITAAIFCWHLRDWIWAQNKAVLETVLNLKDVGDLAKHLVAHCPEFEAIQGIANGSKHFQSQQKEPTGTNREWANFGTLAIWSYTSLTIEFKGNNLKFIDVLKTCVEYWDSFFKQHIP